MCSCDDPGIQRPHWTEYSQHYQLVRPTVCVLVMTPGYKDHIGLSTLNTTNWYVRDELTEVDRVSSLSVIDSWLPVSRVGHNTADALAHIHLLTEFSTGFEICPVIGRSLTNHQSSKTGRQ